MKRMMTAALLFSLAAAAFPMGTVLEADGLVEVHLDERWDSVSTGANIPATAIVATGFRSRAVIELGNSVITIGPLSQVSLADAAIGEREELVTLEMPFGEIRAEVKRARRASPERSVEFRVLSPVSTAAVRGTVFTYDGVELDVAEGRVDLMNGYGQWHSVGAGQESRAYRWEIDSVETTAREAAGVD
jgi:hypothetical protein